MRNLRLLVFIFSLGISPVFAAVGNTETDQIVLGSIVGLINSSGEYMCTGAVIAPDQILSAAHCDEDLVKVSSLEQSQDHRVERSVIKIVKNSKYEEQGELMFSYEITKKNARNDLMLIYLDKSLPASMKPVKLAMSSAFKNSFNFSGVGFGYDPSYFSSVQDLVDRARLLKKRLWEPGTLRTIPVKRYSHLSIRNLRAKTVSGDFSFCKGDSGGLLYQKRGKELILFGIISKLDTLKPERDDLFQFVTLCSSYAVFSTTKKIRKFLKTVD